MRTRLRIDPILVGAVCAYGVASFPSALAGELAAGIGTAGDPALTTVPFCAAFAAGFVFWGRLADRRGAWLVLVLALLGTAVAGVALVSAQGTGSLIAARIAAGAFAAGYPPAAQALLAARGGTARAGRSIGGMFIAVVIATLIWPLLADLLAAGVGWRAAAATLGVVLPAAAAAWLWHLRPAAAAGHATAARAPKPARLQLTTPLVAGCVVATLVLGAYWTLISRLGDILTSEDIDLAAGAVGALQLGTGALGVALVIAAGRATDERGPRQPAVVVLGIGAAGLALAAVQGSAIGLVIALAPFLALYWSYLPIVSVQVARSAPAAHRATALGLLYTSMWGGAAVFGALAALAGDWRLVVAGGGVLWLAAALVAARNFHPAAA